ANGKAVTDANTWTQKRRPEILKLYETEIYGRVPKTAPKVKFEATEMIMDSLDGAARRKEIVGHIGDQSDGPAVHVHLTVPANATSPVPVLLHMVFFAAPAPATNSSSTNAPARPRFSETGPLNDILAHGYGYATFRYSEIEGDARSNNVTIARRLALAAGQT